MSAVSLISRQALRLGIILLVCAGITVVTSTFLQTPMGTAALSTLVRRGGPPEGFQDAPNAGAGPREGGGRLTPNVRAGLPEVLRSAGMMGLFTLVVAVLLRRRKPRPHPAPARLAGTSRSDLARAA
jgi:hypothetical protein